MNWDTVEGTPLETTINAFQDQSGITVNVQPTPTQDYETKMRTLLASGTTPDVMRINDDFVRGYSLANQLLDLRPYIEASGLDAADAFPHNGSLLGADRLSSGVDVWGDSHLMIMRMVKYLGSNSKEEMLP